jgi:hypothetical protein
MRIDNAYSENRINYPWESAPPAFPDEGNASDKVPASPGEKNSLPVVYKRSDINKKDYIVSLSSGDVQVSDEEEPVLQGVFEMDAHLANDMERRFSSWTQTVRHILGGSAKGIYINRFV